jgi:transposase-like protein
VSISKPTYQKIMHELHIKMGTSNLQSRKLGGPGTIVQIDETMMNFKCKSHRGRSPNNRTDCLCIVECAPTITRVWAQTIPDKTISTILPIICERVLGGSVIHTDEHRSYACLSRNGFVHGTVCHKYNFVERSTGVHTQHVESFNNCLKVEIKKRMGVLTSYRNEFLTEFIWRWNNKTGLWNAIVELIKVL